MEKLPSIEQATTATICDPDIPLPPVELEDAIAPNYIYRELKNLVGSRPCNTYHDELTVLTGPDLAGFIPLTPFIGEMFETSCPRGDAAVIWRLSTSSRAGPSQLQEKALKQNAIPSQRP